ncbi:MAG: hypothetical protein Q9224_005912 [Gallowayella concinna]
MKYSVAAIVSASLTGLVAAQGCNQRIDLQKQTGNAVRAPLTEIVPAGTPYNVKWDGDVGSTVSIELLRGPATNILPIACIANNIANTGLFVWTPPPNLVADTTGYGLRIIVADGSGRFQYSNLFGISNDAVHQPTSSSQSSKPQTTPTQSSKVLASTSSNKVNTQTVTGSVLTSSQEENTKTATASVSTSSVAADTTTATVPIVTASANSSSVVVIATTHIPIPVPSSGAVHSLTVLQPTNNMTVPASLQTTKTQQPSGVTASASATSVQTGTGSPIAGPGTTPPDSGAAKVLAGSMLAALGAMAAFLL